jgi:hypothetical protein
LKALTGSKSSTLCLEFLPINELYMELLMMLILNKACPHLDLWRQLLFIDRKLRGDKPLVNTIIRSGVAVKVASTVLLLN